jgi:hypothetical protein
MDLFEVWGDRGGGWVGMIRSCAKAFLYVEYDEEESSSRQQIDSQYEMRITTQKAHSLSQ